MIFEQPSCPPPHEGRGLQRMDEILTMVLAPLGLCQSSTGEPFDDWAEDGAEDAEGEPALCLLEAALT
jgi:hypothetical protein